MENENEFKKGTFEKIDETTYKINGNEIIFSDEGDMDLIPILRDIVVQKENITIEDYNLSKPSYILGKKEIPVVNLITEINNFLNSRRIRRKKLENGICYYETKNGKLSVEEELIPLVEDIINEKVRPIKAYGLQKEVYLINDEKASVNDIVLEICDFACWYCLEPWRIDGIHYKIGEEEFYLKDDDVQIINELINDESDSTWSKYEHKKCVYDINGNECSITYLTLYIIILLCGQIDDNKVMAELKELCLKDKLDRNKKDFMEKVSCFIFSLPKPILSLLDRILIPYYGINIYSKKLTSSAAPSSVIKDWGLLVKGIYLRFDNSFIEELFEGSDEEIELLQQKIELEDAESLGRFINEEIEERRLKPKKRFNMDNLFELFTDKAVSSYEPLTKSYICFLQAFINVYHEEYEQWKDERTGEEIMFDLVNEYYLKKEGKTGVFYDYYNFAEGHVINRFFYAINTTSFGPEVIKSAIDKLHELGLFKYAQERYDEYRKLTGGGKDFCFAKLDVKELSKKLSPYYSNLPSDKKNHSFTDYYLFDIVNDVIPNLESGLDVAAFALLLWESKLFQSSKDNEKFTSFRDDIARIFQLDNIPNISKYTAGKPKVKEKANKLMGQFECLERLLAGKPLT